MKNAPNACIMHVTNTYHEMPAEPNVKGGTTLSSKIKYL